MPRSLPSLALVILLTAGGAISGFLSACLAPVAHGWGGFVFSGALFGLLLTAYLWFGVNMRSAGVVTAIMCESFAALFVAVTSPIIVGPSHGILYILSLDGPADQSSYALRALTIAGLVGAAVVSLGFCALLQPRAPSWRIGIEAGVGAAAGAWLASRAPALAHSSGVFFNTLTWTIVLWQTGVAFVLGVLHMFRGTLERP
jgi:hypothetical protein